MIFKKMSAGLMIISFFSFFLSLNFVFKNLIYIYEYNLIFFNSFEIIYFLYLDWMTFMFVSFVCFISSMVLFYSIDYMSNEKFKARFSMLVILFVLSMMMMIISPNLISILLGWDGLGLVSYCLVIYYQNNKSFNAGMLTALTNRVGDVALLMAIAWMMSFGSWNFLFYIEIMKENKIMQLISGLIVLAAWTKSAQIPFSSWLPAAMAAPTPVSSLVHSSTLVTAGVYLLIRFYFLFSKEIMFLMLFFSLFTMFMSGLSANFEFDLKKIIALSTLSQLGLMMSILMLGEFNLAFFHLLIHAIFKALLFMCAGNFIHSYINCQDIRYMGNLILLMPLTSSFFNISNLSLCGLPFLSGFYSKDLILEFMSMNYLNMLVYLVFYMSIGLTVMYSMRLSYYSLLGNFNFLSLNMINDYSIMMLKGMFGLIMFVIFSGSMIMWVVFPDPYFICLPNEMKFMTLFCILLGGFLGYEFSQFKINYSINMFNNYKFSFFNSFMWNMPLISTLSLSIYPVVLAEGFYKTLDQGWSEVYGAQKLKSQFLGFISILMLVFSNPIKFYLILMLIWLSFLIIL
uniref:NADH-ubiquinone oxidoreductase chain 5 n=1 Tax=Anthribidae sp. 9 ACP-2013 TaxID=1434436 RepID=A0A3G5FNW6_9CUCU|nr:NADH dehydrogenase subunit 5 [Anthribidae sp. 9 ACP-2013]